MSTFIYKDNFDGDVRHIVKPEQRDETLCEEFIDERDGFRNTADPRAFDIVTCSWCAEVLRQRTLDQARSDVARELGVDESEVF